MNVYGRKLFMYIFVGRTFWSAGFVAAILCGCNDDKYVFPFMNYLCASNFTNFFSNLISFYWTKIKSKVWIEYTYVTSGTKKLQYNIITKYLKYLSFDNKKHKIINSFIQHTI